MRAEFIHDMEDLHTSREFHALWRERAPVLDVLAFAEERAR